MRFYVLHLIWQYPTMTSLTLLLMRKNLTGAWFKVGTSKNLSVLSQKAKITWWKGVNVSQRYTHTWSAFESVFQFQSWNWNTHSKAIPVCTHCYTVCFEMLRNSSERSWGFSAQPFKYRQCRQISFFFWKSFQFKSFKCFKLKKFYRLQGKYGILYHFAHIWIFWVLGPLENFPYHSSLVLHRKPRGPFPQERATRMP